MSVFRFKQFDVKQLDNPLKVGTDAMLLGAMIETTDKRWGLDLGAGTGVLSLMIAQKNAGIKIDAVEINSLAAEECLFNFQQSSWSNRLTCFKGDYLNLEFSKHYDLIFSNPPYHLETLVGNDPDYNRAKHSNGEEITELFRLVRKILCENGDFWLILPFQLKSFVENVANENQLFLKQLVRIHSKENKLNSRVIFQFQKKPSSIVFSDFFIRNADNSYTEAYKNLTKAFHFVEL